MKGFGKMTVVTLAGAVLYTIGSKAVKVAYTSLNDESRAEVDKKKKEFDLKVKSATKTAKSTASLLASQALEKSIELKDDLLFRRDRLIDMVCDMYEESLEEIADELNLERCGVTECPKCVAGYCTATDDTMFECDDKIDANLHEYDDYCDDEEYEDPEDEEYEDLEDEDEDLEDDSDDTDLGYTDDEVSPEEREKLIDMGKELQKIAERYGMEISYFSCIKESDDGGDVMIGCLCNAEEPENNLVNIRVQVNTVESNEEAENTECEEQESLFDTLENSPLTMSDLVADDADKYSEADEAEDTEETLDDILDALTECNEDLDDEVDQLLADAGETLFEEPENTEDEALFEEPEDTENPEDTKSDLFDVTVE